MKLMYNDLNNPTFMGALGKLCGSTNLDSKTAYDIAKTNKVINKEIRDALPKVFDVVKKYAVLENERPLQEGEMILRGVIYKDTAPIIKEENKLAYEKEMEDIMKTEIDLPVSPIDMRAIPSGILSGNEFLAIEKILLQD